MGNNDPSFIEKRRVELEGFLRNLLEIDNRIKADQNIKAFLTFDSFKWKDFKTNPSGYLDKMKSVYQAVQGAGLPQISTSTVSSAVSNLYNRFAHEIKGVEEPETLVQDAKSIDFEETQRAVDANLLITQ